MSFTNEEDNSDLSSCERILIDTNTSNNQKLNDNEQYVFNKDLIISEVLPQFMSPTIEGFINSENQSISISSLASNIDRDLLRWGKENMVRRLSKFNQSSVSSLPILFEYLTHISAPHSSTSQGKEIELYSISTKSGYINIDEKIYVDFNETYVNNINKQVNRIVLDYLNE